MYMKEEKEQEKSAKISEKVLLAIYLIGIALITLIILYFGKP